MNTYQPQVNYRKIYEQYYGPIPKDELSRTFHIHHIDGNRTNNSPENLIAVSIQNHYDIHHAQGDWGACVLLSKQLKLTANEIFEMAQKNGKANRGKKRSDEAKDKMRNKKLGVKQNEKQKAHLYGRTVSLESREKSRISNTGKKRSQQTRQNNNAASQRQISNGAHPSQIKWCCINCKTTYSINNLRTHSCLKLT